MMSKNKFKVGDEVRILVPPSAVGMFERGSRGTITNVDYFGCNVVAYDNAVCWYKKEELELVKEAAENCNTCEKCMHNSESRDIDGSPCYLCRKNPVDNRIDWFSEKREPDIYEGDDVIVKEPWEIQVVEGYEGAFCECGHVLLIKTPTLKTWHPIKCPKCGFVVNLFCGKIGEKLGMSDLGPIVNSIGELGD